MARYQPVSKKVVRIVFTLRNSDKWSVFRTDARFGKLKQWAAHVLAAYSEESLSLKVVREFGPIRKTVEVEDGMTVGMGRYLLELNYGKDNR